MYVALTISEQRDLEFLNEELNRLNSAEQWSEEDHDCWEPTLDGLAYYRNLIMEEAIASSEEENGVRIERRLEGVRR